MPFGTLALPLIVLRIAAPCVSSIRAFIAGFQADQQTVNRACVNIASGKRGLERRRLFQRVGECQRAILLAGRDDATPPPARSQITGLLFCRHLAVALFAFFDIEPLQTFIFLTAFHFLEGSYVILGRET